MCTLLKHRLSGFVSSDIGVFTLLHRYINQLCTPADVAPSATPLHLKIGNAPRAHKSQRFGFTNATVGSLCYQLKRWKQWRERTEFSRQRDDSTANLLPVHSHQWPLGKSRLPLRSLRSWPGRQARSAQQRAARACKKKTHGCCSAGCRFSKTLHKPLRRSKMHRWRCAGGNVKRRPHSKMGPPADNWLGGERFSRKFCCGCFTSYVSTTGAIC